MYGIIIAVILIFIIVIYFTAESFRPDYFENYGWAPWGRLTEWYRGRWYTGGHIGASIKMPRDGDPIVYGVKN